MSSVSHERLQTEEQELFITYYFLNSVGHIGYTMCANINKHLHIAKHDTSTFHLNSLTLWSQRFAEHKQVIKRYIDLIFVSS